MRRIYMMMNGDPNFYLLTVPPTSIKDINRQLTKILASGTPYTGMMVSFTLEKTKNSTGTAYSKVQVKKSGLLPPAVAAQVVQLRGQLKERFMELAVTGAEYNSPAQSSSDITPDDEDLNEAFPDRIGQAPFASQFEEAPPLPGEDDMPF